MRKISAILAFLILVGCHQSIPEPVGDAHLSVPDTTTTVTTAASIPPTPLLEGITWSVEPILTHGMWYCPICDNFSYDEEVIDEKTGEITEEYHGSHGVPIDVWVYDPNENLLGSYFFSVMSAEISLHPFSEFTKRFPDDKNRIMLVYEVDSSLRQAHHDEGEQLQHEAAFTGKVAVAYNGEFVTDFVYDEVYWFARERYLTDMVSVFKDDKYGIIDRNGDIIIDFIFDDIKIIDNNTAFARINEKYGIINIR